MRLDHHSSAATDWCAGRHLSQGLVVVLHANLFCNVPITVLNKFTVPDFLGTIQRHRLTTLYVVPPMVVLLAKHPIIEKYDLSSFKKGFCGAAPLTDEVCLLSCFCPAACCRANASMLRPDLPNAAQEIPRHHLWPGLGCVKPIQPAILLC